MKNLKKIFSAVLGWIKGNGIEGIISIPLAIYFLISGKDLYLGISLGVFITLNWIILKNWIKYKLGI